MTKTIVASSSNPRKRAATYGRVSTDEQAKNGMSVEVQMQSTKEQAEKDGYEVVAELKDEGKSGGNMNREGIQEIISLVKDGEIDAVYAIHSDRIARNTLDYLKFRELLREKGVVLKCLYHPTDESATSRTMDTVVASFNEMHRLITSEKVIKTLTAKAQAGYFPTTPPPGYKNIENPNPDTSRLAKKIITVDEETAPLVQEMFRLFATGQYSGYDLADIMYEKGLRTRLGNGKRRGGGKISRSQLFNILRNPIYIGKVSWGSVKNVEGKHEAIIEPYIFNQVQVVLNSHNKHACRRRKYSWLLNGFLYCYSHERRYTAEWHLGKKIAYYHCTYPHGCGKYVEVNDMEAKVSDKFKELELAPEFVDRVIGKAKAIFFARRQEYEKKRKRVINNRTAHEQRIKVLEERMMEREISGADFTRMKEGEMQEIAKFDSQLAELERGHDLQVDIAREILDFTQDIHAAYQKASPNLKRHYLGFFWSKFEVKEGLIIRSNPSLFFDALLKLQQASLQNPKAKKAIGGNKVIKTNVLLLG